jgi:hypothetical protein
LAKRNNLCCGATVTIRNETRQKSWCAELEQKNVVLEQHALAQCISAVTIRNGGQVATEQD